MGRRPAVIACSLFALCAVVAVWTAGCGGGGSQSATPNTSKSVPQSGSVSVQFYIALPSRTSSKLRRALYVSSSTNSATVIVTPSSGTASPATVISCTPQPNPTSCSGAVGAPIGSDTFVVNLFDGANGTGNLLSTGTLVQTITMGTNNSVSVTFNGVVTSLSLATVPSNAGLVGGASSTVTLVVNALDSDGNTIIGPGSYVNSSGAAVTLTLSDSDGSGVTNLSQTTVTAPTTGITVSYNGGTLAANPVITLSATSLTSVNATITAFASPAITDFSIGAAKVQVPTFLVVGQDGNIWFSEQGAVAVGRLTPATPSPTITQFTGTEGNFDIINGPDNNLWVTVSAQSTANPASPPPLNGNAIAKLTFPGPTVTQFPIPTSSSGPRFIASGSDHNMYFTECNVGQIGRVTTAGVVTEFTVPSGALSVPYDIVSGPDGNIWFTEMGASGGCTTTNTGARNIGKLTLSPTPTITEFPTPTGSSEPRIIVSGPDGNLWFTEYGTGNIGKITPAGAITEFPTSSGASNPFSISVGPDNNLWFTEFSGSKIGKITTAGVLTEFTTSASSGPVYLINGPDGALWFTENTSSKIGRITVNGQISEYTTATAAAVPAGLVLGSDNNIYFAESSATVGRIGRVVP